MITADAEALGAPVKNSRVRGWLGKAVRGALQLLLVYLLLLAVHAYLGRWTPDYLEGRDLWHFWFSRMVVPMVMLGVLASSARLIPAGVMLAAAFLFLGTLSAIKREATGEPFQVSDMFLAGQSVHLFQYVEWHHWLLGATVVPAALFFATNLRWRWWSLPMALLFIGLLSTIASRRCRSGSTPIPTGSAWRTSPSARLKASA